MTFKKTLKRKEVKNKDKTHKSLFLASVYPIFEMRQSHSWDSASPQKKGRPRRTVLDSFFVSIQEDLVRLNLFTKRFIHTGRCK